MDRADAARRPAFVFHHAGRRRRWQPLRSGGAGRCPRDRRLCCCAAVAAAGRRGLSMEGGAMVTAAGPVALAAAPAALLDLILKTNDPPSPLASNSATSRERNHGEAVRRYAIAALDRQAKAVEAAGEGTRNEALNNAALSLGHLVGAGALSESTVRGALEAAAAANGLVKDDGIGSVRATITSGLRAGIAQPADLSKIGTRHRPAGGRGRPASEESKRSSEHERRPTDDGGSSDRPMIRIVGGELPEIIDKAEIVLIASKLEIYRYGGELLRPGGAEVAAAPLARPLHPRHCPRAAPFPVDVVKSS